MNFKSFQNWLNSTSYAWFCIAMGGVCLLPFFSYKKNIRTPQSLHNKVSVLNLSSVAEVNKELDKTEYRILQNISDRQLKLKLERNKAHWPSSNNKYAVSLAAIDYVEKNAKRQLPKKFENNPVFKLLEQINDKTVNTEYEDLIICDRNRQFYENRITALPLLKNLLKENNEHEKELARHCVTYSMRQFQLPKTHFALCAKSDGSPQTPGAKPCVTPNLVNLTYNAFMDVTQCLNLNPKNLMPKIDIESGFFLNAYGADKEAGVGQLTRIGIQEVNKHLPNFLKEIEKAATYKKSCANLMAYKSLLTAVQARFDQRCGLIGLPENPLRNIFYMALMNKINLESIAGIKYVGGEDVISKNDELVPLTYSERDEFGGLFSRYGIKEKLEKSGMKNFNPHFFKDLIMTLGYNTGAETAVRLLSSYLDSRSEAGLPVNQSDFDFHITDQKTDLDGKQKSSVEIARSYVMSSAIDPKDSDDVKDIKMRKRKEFPKLWSEAHTYSFPVYLTLRANGYDGQSLEPFPIYGYPGYLNLVTERNSYIRQLFLQSDLDPNSCTRADFLVLKK